MVTLSVTRSWIADAITRLRRRNHRPAPVDSFGVILDAAAETGAVVTAPGIAAWLGYSPRTDDTEDSYDAYLDRISRETA